MGTVELGMVIRIFLISCASIGKVFIVAAGGFFLTKKGIITRPSKKALAGVSSKLCLPCLLFGRIIKSVNWSVLTDAWPIVPFALFYVGMGIALASVLQSCVNTPADQRSAMKACMAFANSQVLPIMMVEVIGPALFDLTAADLGVTYIALYLVMYLVLQWTVGPYLLGVPLGSDAEPEPEHDIQNYVTVAPVSLISAAKEEPVSLESVVAKGEAVSLEGSVDPFREADDCVVEMPLQSPSASGNQAPAAAVPKCKVIKTLIWDRILVAPVIAIWSGLVVGLSPGWVRESFRGEDAPLAFAVQAIDMLGGAAIPLSMMLLGSSLERGPEWDYVHRPTVAGTVIGKLLVMPMVALTVVFVLSGVVHVPQMCLLVILLESSTPSASNLVMMCELAGGAQSKLVATTLFAEYCTVPVVLTLTMTTFMLYVGSS